MSSSSIPPTAIREIRLVQRANGPAAVLAIGTANPPNCVSQEEYPDYYFRVTNSDRLTELKHTFTKVCGFFGIRNRFFHDNEDLLAAHPDFLLRRAPWSIDGRLDIIAAAAPELAACAPGCDVQLVSILGLRHDVRRTAIQLNGCAAGCASLRLSRNARVLVVCIELTVTSFRGPDQADTFDTLLSQGLFGDGAGAIIVGAETDVQERPLFEMVAASQTLIPDTEHLLTMRLGDGGIDGTISTGLPRLAEENVEQCLLDAFGGQLAAVGVVEWNDLFWAVHPGSCGMLDKIGRALRLAPDKLAASRSVMGEYGNMLSATVIFVLDEVRRRMDHDDDDDAEWGMMMGFGPGFTVEMMLLHAAARNLSKK